MCSSLFTLSGSDVEVKSCVEMSENLMPSQSKATENHKEMPQSSGKELDASSMQRAEPKKLDQLVSVIISLFVFRNLLVLRSLFAQLESG